MGGQLAVKAMREYPECSRILPYGLHPEGVQSHI